MERTFRDWTQAGYQIQHAATKEQEEVYGDQETDGHRNKRVLPGIRGSVSFPFGEIFMLPKFIKKLTMKEEL